jgi:hypothetical protein
MFYQFHLPSTPLTQCFIAAIVPPREEMEAGNKSFSALGDISAIEVWNVTHPGRLTSLSWNTRPQRLELMGTVNFTSDQRESGWQLLEPTPRFACGKGFYNIEVACSACRLEFLQIFSDPALGEWTGSSRGIIAHRYDSQLLTCSNLAEYVHVGLRFGEATWREIMLHNRGTSQLFAKSLCRYVENICSQSKRTLEL